MQLTDAQVASSADHHAADQSDDGRHGEDSGRNDGDLFDLPIVQIRFSADRCGVGIQLQSILRCLILVILHLALLVHHIDQAVIVKAGLIVASAGQFLFIDGHRRKGHALPLLQVFCDIDDKQTVS